jgi:mRNA interferase MazF
MKEGDIVLTVLPQDNGQKRRPVLILSKLPGIYSDFLVCAISTQIHQYVDEFDIVLDEMAPFFVNTGLLKKSIVRLGSLAVIPSSEIVGTTGSLEPHLFDTLLKNLSDHLNNYKGRKL